MYILSAVLAIDQSSPLRPSSVKHRRLRYLTLLALRSLLLVLLAVAFAHPYLRLGAVPHSRSGEVTVLAIDNSLSMQAGGRLEQAKRVGRFVMPRQEEMLVIGVKPGRQQGFLLEEFSFLTTDSPFSIPFA